MPKPTIATQVHQPFYIHGDFCSKLTFYLVFTVDYLAYAVDFSLGKIVCVGIRVDIQFVKDPIGGCSPNTIYIGQSDFYPFPSR
jgi:hypothetical protein